MIYNGQNGDSIIEDITFRTSADLNQFPLLDRTRYANEAYSLVAVAIMKADGRMTWDDPNHSNQPIATTDIVANQAEYNIFSNTPSALQDWLSVQRVDIFDSGGAGIQLSELDQNDFKGVAQSEMDKSPSLPYAFDLNGTILRLYPAPDYSYAKGMTIWFDRSPSYFVPLDTIKRPGFDTRFHYFIPLYVAHKFNSIKKKDFSAQAEIDKTLMLIGINYAVERDKSENQIIKRRFQSFR